MLLFHHRHWKNSTIPKRMMSKAYNDSSLPPMHRPTSLMLESILKEGLLEDGIWDWKVLAE